jgi:hypothetical protein
VIEDFVAGVQEGAKGEVKGLADADGDEDFVLGIVFGAESLSDVGCQGAAQFEVTEVAGVMGDAAFESENGGFAHVPWGIEVGFADAQADDILHRRNDVKEIADAGSRDVANGGVKPVKERR